MLRRAFTTGFRLKLALVLALGGLALAAPALTPAPAATAKERYRQWDGGRHPTIGRGDKGKAVKHAQCLLNLWNGTLIFVNLEEDGDFGPLTLNAVKDFQTAYGLKYTGGVIGHCTWLALHPGGDDPGPECYPTPPPIQA
jgi:peptidoglycan hydrolase-like protein with peptidoglycan-binding domain